MVSIYESFKHGMVGPSSGRGGSKEGKQEKKNRRGEDGERAREWGGGWTREIIGSDGGGEGLGKQELQGYGRGCRDTAGGC